MATCTDAPGRQVCYQRYNPNPGPRFCTVTSFPGTGAVNLQVGAPTEVWGSSKELLEASGTQPQSSLFVSDVANNFDVRVRGTHSTATIPTHSLQSSPRHPSIGLSFHFLILSFHPPAQTPDCSTWPRNAFIRGVGRCIRTRKKCAGITLARPSSTKARKVRHHPALCPCSSASTQPTCLSPS